MTCPLIFTRRIGDRDMFDHNIR